MRTTPGNACQVGVLAPHRITATLRCPAHSSLFPRQAAESSCMPAAAEHRTTGRTCSCGLTTESEASVPILQVPTMALPLCSVFRMYLSTSSSDCTVPTGAVLRSLHLAHGECSMPRKAGERQSAYDGVQASVADDQHPPLRSQAAGLRAGPVGTSDTHADVGAGVDLLPEPLREGCAAGRLAGPLQAVPAARHILPATWTGLNPAAYDSPLPQHKIEQPQRASTMRPEPFDD